MKKIAVLFITLLFSSLLFGLTTEEIMHLSQDSYFSTKFYGGSFNHGLFDKVRIFEGNAADFLASYDECDSYKNHELNDSEKKLFQEYFSYLPEKIQACVLENVFAVYFVDGMRYGGLTQPVFDESGKQYCILFLNSNTFQISLDSWLEYRDNSIFTETDDQNKIKVLCSNDYQAFLHVLFHETAHVYDYINDIAPFRDEHVAKEKTDSIFFSSWKSYFSPVKKYDNKLLKTFGFYDFGERIPVENARNLVNFLSTATFSSLYGAKNIQDCFAETITFYCFAKKFNINYELQYLNKGRIEALYNLKKNSRTHVWDPLCKEITGF